MRFIKRLLIATLVISPLLTNASLAGAENLQQSWDIALKHNPMILASAKQVEAAQIGIEGAKTQRMPSVTGNVGYTWFDNPQVSIAGAAQMQVSEKRMYSFGANMSLPIYTGGYISSSVKNAEVGLRIAENDKESLVNTIKLRVAESYINILRTRRLMIVAGTRLNSLRSHHKNVEQLLEQGMVAKSDLLSVQASLADAKQSLLQAKNANELARSQYNYLLGRDLVHKVVLEDLDHTEISGSLASFIKQAQQNRTELIKIQNQKQSLVANIDMVRSAIKPNIAFNTGYKYQENSYTKYEGQWSATIGVQWKLFDGGQSGKKKSELLRHKSALDDQENDLKNRITLEVRSAWLKMNETKLRIAVVEEAVSQSEESLRNIKAKYAAGMSTHSEVLDAEALRELSSSNYYNARYDAALARIELKHAVGAL